MGRKEFFIVLSGEMGKKHRENVEIAVLVGKLKHLTPSPNNTEQIKQFDSVPYLSPTYIQLTPSLIYIQSPVQPQFITRPPNDAA